MGTSRATLLTQVRDILAEPTAARFSDPHIYDALRAGLNDVSWRLPDDSAMCLRRTVTQVLMAGLAYYPLPNDFMFEKGILSCSLAAVPCGIVTDMHLLEGYKTNSLITPDLLTGPIAWLQEQVVASVNTWCINTLPAPDTTGSILIYLYRAIPATLGASQGSELPTSCDEPVSLYAAMKLKGGRDDSDVSNVKGLYKAALGRIGANVENL